MIMSDLTELREERAKLINKAQKVIDESDDDTLTSEEQQKFDRLHDRVTELREEITQRENNRDKMREIEEAAEDLEEPVVGERGLASGKDADNDRSRYEEERGEYRDAFFDYLRHGKREMSQASYERFQRGRPQPETRESNVVVGTSNTGGVLAPVEFEEELFEEMKQFGGLRGQTNADIFQTDHGRDIEFPTMTDTANTASRVSEGSTIGSVSDLDLDLVTLQAHKYQSGPFALSREFLQDSRLEPEGMIRGIIGTRIGRKTAEDYISSTGGNDRPEGLITHSTGAVSIANGSSNLGFTDLKDLKYNVDRAHRTRDPEWLMTDQTFKEVSKITDSNGQFLLDPRVTEDDTLRLLGDPVRIDNSSTAIEFGAGSTGAKPIWYGAFEDFRIRDVLRVTIRRLDETFALQDKTGFVGFLRTDANMMVDPSITASQRPVRALLETT